MITAYSLLHVDPDATALNNLRSTNDLALRLEIYLRNAVLLSKSLSIHGIGHCVLTNDPTQLMISNPCRELFDQLNTQTISVTDLKLPPDIPHRATFHKLDAWRWIARNSEDYSLMIDLDMVCLSGNSFFWEYLCQNQVSTYYDVTDQVAPAWGPSALSNEQQYMLKYTCLGRWSGGEFLSGNSNFFHELSSLAFQHLPLYASSPYQIHSGEEAVLSASLDSYRTTNHLEDSGSLGVVSRFWRGNVKHHQKPLQHHLNAMFIHLPGDKPFLASYQMNNPGSFDADHFRAEYSSLCNKKTQVPRSSKWQSAKSALKSLLR